MTMTLVLIALRAVCKAASSSVMPLNLHGFRAKAFRMRGKINRGQGFMGRVMPAGC